MSKFDIILLFCFTCTVAAGCAEVWMICHHLPGFGTGFWTYLTAATAGEIVMFSLYQIVKEKQGRVPKAIEDKHQLIREMEEEDEKQIDEP